ncbi:MAG: GNAT family N-acetyltransferase [Acidobacteria bacterium]|nr:GNAT family N-acetyltransferase [Acidobacteriota bacterium]
MEILDLRQLRSLDLEPLLEEETAVWEECLQWDYSSSADLIKRFVDARALAGYAAVEGGQAVGYCFYIYENLKGLIGDAFVSGAYSNGQTEVRLLTHVLETMQATPGIRRIETQLMNFNDQAARPLFLAQHFQSYHRKFLYLPLTASRKTVSECPAEVALIPWHSRWFAEAGLLITRAYRGHVDSAISDQYRSRAGALRFLENIVRYPGCGIFNPEGSVLVFHKEARLLCGMLLTSAVHERVAHITQLCVDPDLQGRGIGSWLLQQALPQLQQRGFQGVTLTVTASNAPALRLYERFGFSTLKEFNAYAWDAAGSD